MAPKAKPKPFFSRVHDDEYVDEVRFTTKPRFKTSGLSGDQWRVSVHMEFLRKGHVVFERSFHTMRDAAAAFPWYNQIACETEEWKHLPDDVDHRLCAQPGCPKPAVHFFQVKKKACREGHVTDSVWDDERRGFCREHKHRGDQGLEDCDSNYVPVEA